MKKALILISFILAAVASFGQFVNTQTIASPTTLYKSKGGIMGDSALILPQVVFADTTAANFSVASKYSGSIIKIGTSLYYRNLNPNRWILVPASTSATVSWGGITGTLTNQIDLYDTISARVRYIDTAGMLLPYLRKSDTLTMLLPYLRKTDTATMLLPYLRKTDTASMLSNSTLDRVLANGNTTGRNAFLGYLAASGASATPTVTGAYLFDQRLLSVSSGGGSRPFAIDAQYISFGTGNTYVEKARIDSFGSLLIGTTTSNSGAYKLDVVGSARLSSLPSYSSGGTYVVSNSGILSSRTASEVRADIGAGTGNGTVTSVAAGNGLSFTTITTSGTITADTSILSTKDNVLNQLNKYTGTTNTVTVGTITTGTWNGNTLGVAYGGTGLTSLASQRIPFGNGTSAFGSSSGLTWDGTNMNASNFSVFSGGSYSVPGSSGGTNTLMYNANNSFILKSAFDTLRLQGGANTANKRQVAFYIGDTQGYKLLLDENGKFLRSDALSLSLNNNEYATTAFVKGQGYLTTAVTSATGTADQVNVSASTGAVTFTLPQSIATTSNVQFGTLVSSATSTYSSGTTYSIAATPTTTFSGTLPTTNASFSAVLAPFANVISDNTTVNGNTSFGALLASSVLSFSNAAYKTLTMSASSGGIKANSAIVAGTFDAGTQRGNVNASAGVMINGIFKSGTYSLKRDNHYQLLVNGADEFANADSVTNKWGIYQNGANDLNYFAGKVKFGTTSAQLGANETAAFYNNSASFAVSAVSTTQNVAPIGNWNTATSGDNVFELFYTEGSPALRGSISYNRGSGVVAYNTTSDYRAKRDEQPIYNALQTVSTLKPKSYFMLDGTRRTNGFFAHELQSVVPQAVTGTKDAVDSTGKPIYQQVDLSQLIPVLTKAIQEQQTQIEALKQEIIDMKKLLILK